MELPSWDWLILGLGGGAVVLLAWLAAWAWRRR